VSTHSISAADLPRYLTPGEIAKMLVVSEDTVIRQFEGREGVIDLGSQESMHKRRKRMLRIPMSAFDAYVVERQVKVRTRH
jgi:hypothetical protein